MNGRWPGLHDPAGMADGRGSADGDGLAGDTGPRWPDRAPEYTDDDAPGDWGLVDAPAPPEPAPNGRAGAHTPIKTPLSVALHPRAWGRETALDDAPPAASQLPPPPPEWAGWEREQEGVVALSWPEANLFPLGWESDFEALALDVHLHGQRLPIIRCAGKLVDGRRRWLACRRLGLPPVCVELDLPDVAARVVAAATYNAHRRIQSEGALAMVVAKAVAHVRREGVTISALASATQLRRQRVYEALRVIAFRPDLVEPVARGQRNLYEAFKEASAEARRRRARLAPRPESRRRGRPLEPIAPERVPRRWGQLWRAVRRADPLAVAASLQTEAQAAVALQEGLHLQHYLSIALLEIRRRWPGISARNPRKIVPPTR